MASRPHLQRALARTWWGAGALCFGGLLFFLVVGQLVPGIFLGIWIMVDAGSQLGPTEIEERLAPYIPLILLFGLPAAAILVFGSAKMRLLAPKPDRKKLAWLWVAGCVIACYGGQHLITYVLTGMGVEFEEQELITKAAKQGGAFFFLAVAVVGPLAEELVFRRFLFSMLAVPYGRILAYVGSALIFALIHFHPPGFLLYLWMAVCFTVAYEKTGSVWGAFTVHAVNNGLAVAFMGQQ